MRIEIDLREKPAEQAGKFFEKSKKAKKKLEGLEKALKDSKKKLSLLSEETVSQKKPIMKKRSMKWFEKFHWFNSSEGFLVLAGRDAKSNEFLIKSHMEASDLYFHAEIHGSPHCIIKNGQAAENQTLKEAAQFVASFSSAWKQDLSKVDVYSVLPEQVSKSAPSGESMKSGSFMIYGKREWFKSTPLALAVGVKKEEDSFVVVSGPREAVKESSEAFLEVVQGQEKKGAIAKKILAFFHKKLGFSIPIDLDEVIRMLPNGGMKLL